MTHRNRCFVWVLVALCLSVATVQLWALVDPPTDGPLHGKAFRHGDFQIPDSAQSVSQLPPQASAKAQQALANLGVGQQGARVDARGGRFETLLPSKALVAPGIAAGQTRAQHGEAARNAFRNFLNDHRQELDIDPGQLSSGLVTVHGDGDVVQIHMQRVVDGIPVRGSYINGVINHGKLALYGTHRWGDVRVSRQPQLSAAAALASAQGFLAPHGVTGSWGKDQLLLVPTVKDQGASEVGKGYGHRLVWQLHPSFAGDQGSWEVLVDAHTGEVLSFEDTNHYAEAKLGVYPVTNDGIVPDGVEQAGWPAPFDNISTTGGTITTDTGGNLNATGNMTSNLSGQYVRINDNCGAISLTQSGGIDFGTSGGTDCVTPGFGGAGNTHASRTGFYELNRIKEMARGQLPGNSWLQQQLTSNMNINNTCNAFWNGSTVNFYRSGGGCFNTGEIAGVFDHEWGHGMDANDASPGIASPSGEGVADIYTALRLNDSCIGRNFRSTVCSGNGDPCLTCTGVRDIDYLKRASGQPHDYSWSNANCGGSVHCVGGVYSEAVWSLWKRELTGAPYNLDNNTAHEVVNRLTFIGAGATGTWFSGGPPFGGCSSSSGYMNYLAADDDNGNLNDGTPHMTAIFNAFNDQEIACGTPTVQDAGCAGTPTAAPNVTATPADKSVGLSWTAVAGVTEYEVFRTEGVFACDFGKVKIGTTTGTVWNDSGLQNGRNYSYVVIAKGSHDACFGPASSCTSATPASGPNLEVDSSSGVLSILGGDGDQFIDNCENGTLTFDVNNTGLGGLTNVRIVGVTATSHPATTVTTAFPAAVSPSSLAEGGTGSGSFAFTAGGLAFGDTLTFQVEVTADELTGTRLADLSINSAETDFQNFPSLTYTFEAGTDGWSVVAGTFNRTSTGGGGQGTTWYEASSANLDNQCDHIRSPVVSLNANSTLSLYNQYDIEPQFTNGLWYDRANIGIYQVDSGSRTAVNPDGGRLYQASGAQGTCGTTGQGGWADANTTWGQSTFSASALGSAGFAGQPVQLDVRYGTDASLTGFGFHFDQVTLTNVDVLVADTQSDTCGGPVCTLDSECDDSLFCNGAETCNAGSCQAGTPVSCGDGVGCTIDSCNEATDSCDNVTSDAACNNGLFCDGVETCDAVLDCQAGTAVNCNDGVGCTADSCNEGTDSCDNVPNNAVCDNGLFCDGAETCDIFSDCQAGSDPCALGDICDEAGDVCTNPNCNNNGVCESGEDCGTCPNDCVSGPIPGASCGNGLCETADGEDCLTCAVDCNGKQGGNPNNRFCCGSGGQNPVGCADSRCSSSGFSCTTTPAPGGSYCCGDLVCDSGEDASNCALDCGGACDLFETSCTDAQDNDCDGLVDCADSDCGTNPACACTPPGGSCSSGAQCCSGNCKGNGTCK